MRASGSQTSPSGEKFAPRHGGPSGGGGGRVTEPGAPEIVWATIDDLYVHRPDGTLVLGFRVAAPPQHEFRTVPTLADLDGDGSLDIVVGARGDTASDPGQVLAFRYSSGNPTLLPGWPREVDDNSLYASASVGDLDGGGPDVVVESYDRIYAWHADGTPVAGLHGAPLAAPIDQAETAGSGSVRSSSQPALADLNGDGTLEIIVGSNVLRADGTALPGWEGAKPGARNSLSAAVGDLDGVAGNGFEVVLGTDAWHADGTTVTGRPFPSPLASAVLGDCGDGDLDTIVGSRDPFEPGVAAFRPDGTMLEGYPKSLYGNTGDAGAPVIGDFDADGLVDVATAITDAGYGGVVAVWDMPGTNHDERHAWPMLGHDVRHTGLYTLPPPNRPANLAATLEDGALRLTWEDRSAVEDAYVVERSATGAPWTYSAIAQLPANTTAYVTPVVGGTYRVRATRQDPQSGTSLSSVASDPVQP